MPLKNQLQMDYVYTFKRQYNKSYGSQDREYIYNLRRGEDFKPGSNTNYVEKINNLYSNLKLLSIKGNY